VLTEDENQKELGKKRFSEGVHLFGAIDYDRVD
jgi:hypothetical protein